MGTKCAPLLAHLLHYSFEADAMQGLLKTKISELSTFNLKLHNTNDATLVIFFYCIYPTELQTKDTKDATTSAPYLDIWQQIYSEGRLKIITLVQTRIFQLSYHELYM
jgi:hypothetical protein